MDNTDLNLNPVTSSPARHALGRKLLIALCVVVIIIGLLYLGLRLYLSSPGAVRMVTSKLEDTLGVTVQVKSVSAGFSSSTVGGIAISEEDGANNGKPWATAQEVSTDVSLASLARGVMPSSVTLKQAEIVLRFDSKGVMLTKFPEGANTSTTSPSKSSFAMPAIRIEKSQLRIEQEGHPTALFGGVDGLLKSNSGALVLEGTMTDENWGQWRLALNVDIASRSGEATLRTSSDVEVSEQLLRSVPFVPVNVWEAVVWRGPSSVEVRFDLKPQSKTFHYAVTVHPKNAEVKVSDIDLIAHQVTGQVDVEDGIVNLSQLKGQTAQGDLNVDGILDFQKQPNSLKVGVDAKNLLIKELPENWEIQKKVPVKGIGDGRLTGHADLLVSIGSEGVTTGGSGTAQVIVPSFVSGQDLKIDLRLAPRGRRYEFGQKSTSSTGTDHRPVPPAWLHTLLMQPPQTPAPSPSTKEPPKAKDGEDNYLNLNFALRDVDLGELVNKLEVGTPFKIGGRITFQVKAAIPTNQASDLKSYRFTGTADLPELKIEDLTLKEVKAEIRYRDGLLTLTNFSGQMPEKIASKNGGSFQGTASLGLIPAGDLKADLQLRQLPLDQMLGLFPAFAKGAEGNFTGQFNLAAPAGQLRDPSKWSGQANLNSEQAKALGLTFHKVQLAAQLAEGVLNLKNLSGDIEEGNLKATGNLRLVDQYPWQGRIELRHADLSALNKLYPDFQPPVQLAGKLEAQSDLKGTLNPLNYQLTGTGSLAQLQIEKFPVDKIDFHWNVDPNQLRLTEISSQLFAGTIAGEAAIPLKPEAAGTIDLKLKKVNLGNLSQSVPTTANLRLEGQAEGFLKATVHPVKNQEPRQTELDADIRADHLKVRGIAADKLHATAKLQRSILQYKLEAAALGGTIELDGRYPPTPDAETKKDPQQQSRLQLRGLQLARFWPGLGLSDTLKGLNGDLYLDLPFNIGASGEPTGSGSLRLDRLRYRGRELTPRINSRVRFVESMIRVEQIEAPFGTGFVRGLILINYRQFDQSRAILSLRNVPAKNLLFLVPDLADQIDAPLDAEIRTSLGSQIRGNGTLSLMAGKLMGQRAGSIRLPLQWDFVPAQQRGSFAVRDLSGEIAQGRLSGSASYEFFGHSGGRAEGEIKFRNVSLPSLTRSENLGSLGVGNATGQFSFSGSEVRSFDDLKGTLTSTLGQAQLSEIPVLKEVLPFLGPSARVADKQSEVKATLSRGNWRVEKLALVGQNLQLYGTGTVSNSGRLNLAMTANTGRFDISPLALRAFGITLPTTVGPIPLGLIVQLSSFLSNRTVNLEVTGTLSRPSVRIKPISLLTEEVIRFFLNQNNIPLP